VPGRLAQALQAALRPGFEMGVPRHADNRAAALREGLDHSIELELAARPQSESRVRDARVGTLSERDNRRWVGRELDLVLRARRNPRAPR